MYINKKKLKGCLFVAFIWELKNCTYYKERIFVYSITLNKI